MNKIEGSVEKKIIEFPLERRQAIDTQKETDLQREVSSASDELISAFKRRDSHSLFEAVCGLSDVFLGRKDEELRREKKARTAEYDKFFGELKKLAAMPEDSRSEFDRRLKIALCGGKMSVSLRAKHSIDKKGEGYDVIMYGYEEGDKDVFAGQKTFKYLEKEK